MEVEYVHKYVGPKFRWERIYNLYLPSTVTPVRVHTSTLVGNCVYIWGGYASSCCVSTLLILNLDNQTLLQVHKIEGEAPPEPVAYHTANAIGKKIYFFGGTEFERKTTNEVYVLDTEELVWSRLEVVGDKPPPRCGHMSFTIGEKLFIYGGSNKLGDYNSDLWMLDIERKVWVELDTHGDVPIGRNSGIMSVVGDYVYLFGGRTVVDFCVSDFYRLHLATLEWQLLHEFDKSELIPDGEEREDAAAAEGESQQQYPPHKKRTIIRKVPSPRVDHRANVLKNKIFLTMGTQLDGSGNLLTFPDVHCYDADKDSWTLIPTEGDIPEGVCGHTATLYKDKIWLFGGLNSGYKESNLLYVLHIPPTELSLVDLCVNTIKKHRLYSPHTEHLPLPKELVDLLS